MTHSVDHGFGARFLGFGSRVPDTSRPASGRSLEKRISAIQSLEVSIVDLCLVFVRILVFCCSLKTRMRNSVIQSL